MLRKGTALALSIAALASFQTPAIAGAPPIDIGAKTVAHDSVESAIARSLIAAINGSKADRAAWIDAYASGIAQERKRGPVWQEVLDAMGPRYGNLTFADAKRAGRMLAIHVTNAKSSRTGRLTIFLSADQASKVDQIWRLPIPPAIDESALPDTLDMKEARQAIAELVDKRAATGDFSGSVLIKQGGTILFEKAAGLADRDTKTPNMMDTPFHLGSMDKMFTATLIGQLIEAGKLSFDTRLIDILPDYPNQDAARKITIDHLLTHRAGLGMWWDRAGYDRLKPHDRVGELLPTFAAEPLLFEPGEGQDYSNEGFIVLGAVIEKVTGQSYYDLVRDRVFVPAGMKDTGYPRFDELQSGYAVGYHFPEGDVLGIEEKGANWDLLGYRGNSCGGGYSTAADMARFLDALKAGRLLSPAMVDRMTARDPRSIPEYGMGFINAATGSDTQRGHDGGGPFSGINSSAKKLWNHDIDVVVMGNYDAPFAQNLGDAIAQILERVPVAQ